MMNGHETAGRVSRRSGLASRIGRWVLGAAVVLAGGGAGLRAPAAEEPLVDCHTIDDCEDRLLCNRAIRRALSQVNNTTPLTYENGSERYTVVAVQQERQERLRSFVAPSCPESPATASPAAGAPPARPGLRDRLIRLFSGRGIRETDDAFVRPAFGRPILGKTQDELPGRWEGWITARERKATRMIVHLFGVRNGVLVRGCSDHGMVLGKINDHGVLELPRAEPLSMGARVRLWWSPPDYQQLAGVSLLELQPGHEVINGSVWLERAVKYDGSAPPTVYDCHDRDIEDQKRATTIRELRKEIESLRKDVEVLKGPRP